MALQYFNGQGKVDIAGHSSGSPSGAFRWLGNAPSFKFIPEATVSEHKESYTGNKAVDVRLRTELKGTVEITFEQLDVENLKLLGVGESVSQAATPVSAETLVGSTTPAVGQVFYLANVDVSSLVITDSTGTPKTLTLNTNYLADTKSGRVELIDITTGGAFVGPLKAAYTPAAVTRVKLFTAAAAEHWIVFSGINTAVSGSPKFRAEFYRVSFDPAELDLITDGDQPAQFTLRGTALIDSTKAASSAFGQLGRLDQLA
jgi:hypothetical protein